MKVLDIIIASAAAYSVYKIAENRSSVASLQGDYNFKKSSKQSLYKLDDSIFRYLEDPVQTVLLQCFAQDYTAPRMITDENLYKSAVAAANKTGAPCAWVQIVAVIRPNANLENSAENMLKFCDDFIVSNKNNIDLKQLRSAAISRGISS